MALSIAFDAAIDDPDDSVTGAGEIGVMHYCYDGLVPNMHNHVQKSPAH